MFSWRMLRLLTSASRFVLAAFLVVGILMVPTFALPWGALAWKVPLVMLLMFASSALAFMPMQVMVSEQSLEGPFRLRKEWIAGIDVLDAPGPLARLRVKYRMPKRGERVMTLGIAHQVDLDALHRILERLAPGAVLWRRTPAQRLIDPPPLVDGDTP